MRAILENSQSVNSFLEVYSPCVQVAVALCRPLNPLDNRRIIIADTGRSGQAMLSSRDWPNASRGSIPRLVEAVLPADAGRRGETLFVGESTAIGIDFARSHGFDLGKVEGGFVESGRLDGRIPVDVTPRFA